MRAARNASVVYRNGQHAKFKGRLIILAQNRIIIKVVL